MIFHFIFVNDLIAVGHSNKHSPGENIVIWIGTQDST